MSLTLKFLKSTLLLSTEILRNYMKFLQPSIFKNELETKLKAQIFLFLAGKKHWVEEKYDLKWPSEYYRSFIQFTGFTKLYITLLPINHLFPFISEMYKWVYIIMSPWLSIKFYLNSSLKSYFLFCFMDNEAVISISGEH